MSNSNLEVCKANEISELKDLTKYRLDEINKIKEYFNAEIKERKYIIKKNSKYIVAFDYADKVFITLSASFGTLSIASYATGSWNTCRNSWSIFNFNISRNEWCG